MNKYPVSLHNSFNYTSLVPITTNPGRFIITHSHYFPDLMTTAFLLKIKL